MSEYISQFGWEGDDDFGEQLIQEILDGRKTTACSLKVLYAPEELILMKRTIGKPISVINKYGRSVCRIKIKDVYETSFAELVHHLFVTGGDKISKDEIKSKHLDIWKRAGLSLSVNDETRVIVEAFELIK